MVRIDAPGGAGTDWRQLEYQTRMQRHAERSAAVLFRAAAATRKY